MARKKYAKRYLKPTTFDSRHPIFNGLVWQVLNSRGDDHYSVTLHDMGFECDCPGFGYHGYCKHSRQILKQIEEAIDGRVPQYAWV